MPVVVHRIYRPAPALMTGSQLRIHRRVRIGFWVRSLSDTQFPHERPFTGSLKRHLRLAPVSAGAAVLAVAAFSLAGIDGLAPAATDRDRYGVLGVCPQGPAPRVVGERAAGGSQVVDQFRGPGGGGDLPGLMVMVRVDVLLAVEQDGKGGQMGRDLVLADVGVLRPGGVRLSGAGVAVAAPVGRAAVRP